MKQIKKILLDMGISILILLHIILFPLLELIYRILNKSDGLRKDYEDVFDILKGRLGDYKE